MKVQTFYPRKNCEVHEKAWGYLYLPAGCLKIFEYDKQLKMYGYSNNLSSSTVSNLNSSGKCFLTCCVVITLFVKQIFHMLTFASAARGEYIWCYEYSKWTLCMRKLSMSIWMVMVWWESIVTVCFGVRFHDYSIKLQEFYGSLHKFLPSTISCYAVIYRELLTHSLLLLVRCRKSTEIHLIKSWHVLESVWNLFFKLGINFFLCHICINFDRKSLWSSSWALFVSLIFYVHVNGFLQ